MDVAWFSQQMTSSRMRTTQGLYPTRPWMEDKGAAVPAIGGSGISVRGIVAGGITGAIEICITYPTEFVKTQLQLDGKAGERLYTGIFDCITKTIKNHGFFGLYRGLSILVYGSIPKSAVRFGGFETAKNQLVDEDGKLSPTNRFVAGLFAGVGEAIVAVTPMETIKVKFVNDQRLEKPRFKGFLHGVSLMIAEDGIKGIYKGLGPTILKQGTNQAIRFFVMESLKEWYKGNDSQKHIPKYIVGGFGLLAGAASVYGNTPLDVVKTRMQGLEASKYKSSLDCAARVLKDEGVFAFYKGTVPRLGRVCLDTSISFMVYDSIIELFNKVWP